MDKNNDNPNSNDRIIKRSLKDAKYISSAANQALKEVRALKASKYRDESGKTFVEGRKLINEVIDSGVSIDSLFISEESMKLPWLEEIILKVYDSGWVETHVIPDKLFSGISDTDTPQGVLATIKIKWQELDKILELEKIRKSVRNLFLLLDNIRDPGNLGTMIRTADAAAFSGVICTNGCVDAWSPKVLRAAMGSTFHIPLIKVSDTAICTRHLQKSGINVFAADMEGGPALYDIESTRDFAVIIGSEGCGVSQEVLSLVDGRITIPMSGRAESLNAATAATLIMFESVRQRRHK